MLDAHSLRAYPVPPLALLPKFTEIREGVFPETPDSPGPLGVGLHRVRGPQSIM